MKGSYTTLTIMFVIGLLSAALGYALSQPTSVRAGVLNAPAGLPPVDSAFTYQGTLSDGDAPANGDYDFQFILYDAISGGSQVGSTVPADDVTVEDGLFSVKLDFGSNAFAGDARWLDIGVRPGNSNAAYTILSPRQELTPAPYALGLQPGATIAGATSEGILNLNNADNDALFVGSAGGDGVEVSQAGNPSATASSNASSGFKVAGAEGYGLFVGRADEDGVAVDSTGADGFDVNVAGNNGLEIGSVGGNGVYVGSAGNEGVYVDSSNSTGVRVGSAGHYGVYVYSAGYHGYHVESAGLDGVRVFSAGDNGIEVGGSGNLAGLFYGDVQINGTCTGCILATFGRNSSNQSLEPGTIVSLNGANAPAETLAGTPILMEVGPAQAGEAIVGVVDGRAEIDAGEEEDDAEQPHLVPRDGAAAPGDYVTIIIDGLAQVQASAFQTAINAGDRLTVNQTGAARALQTIQVATVAGGAATLAEDAPTIGIALQGLAAGEEGLIWVLVNPH